MGFISELAKSSSARGRKTTPDLERGRSSRDHWRQVFNSTNKEDSVNENREPPVRKPILGGSFGRSSLAEPAAFKRLLQAMRSMAPGGWSDDRWEQSKHFVGIQYICSHRIGEQMAQAEFQVYEKDESNQAGKIPVTKRSNPDAYKLVELLEKPNNDDSFGDLMYRWNQQMDLTGTALTWMVPNQLQKPFELYCIPTAIAIPQPTINPDYPDGFYRIQPLYPYGPFSSYPTPSTSVGAPIPAQWMLRFQFPHPLLRYEGYSPLTALRLHVDELESMDRSRWYNMKRVFNPVAVLNFENMEGVETLPEPEIERIRAEFENSFQGPENTGQLFVSAPGSKLEQWGTSPREMDYAQSWDQLVSFIMAGYGITKPAAGMVDDSSYSTLFATLKQLHLLTLEPKLNRIAAKLTRHVAPFFGENLIVEIRCKRIDDHDVNNAKIEKGTSAKCITKNEVRVLLDLPTTHEDWGKEIAGTEAPQEGQEGAPRDMLGMGEATAPSGSENPAEMNQEGLTGQEDQGDQDQEPGAEAETPEELSVGTLGPQMKRLDPINRIRMRLRKSMHSSGRNGFCKV